MERFADCSEEWVARVLSALVDLAENPTYSANTE